MILLLTGCINPNGMSLTVLNNPKERQMQYEKAIQYYLLNTSYPIVFVENSGTNISSSFQDYIASGRIECLTFMGNQDKTRGKGYGESEIIQFALDNSKLIKKNKDNRIAKITGRLIIKNIKKIVLIHKFILKQNTILCSINSALTFPDSRFIIASKNIFLKLARSKEEINDSESVFFEHILLRVIIRERLHFSPFFIMPQIEGMSGSTGEKYESKKHNFIFTIRYAKYALSLLLKFYGKIRY